MIYLDLINYLLAVSLKLAFVNVRHFYYCDYYMQKLN